MTALDLITGALRLIGAIATGETPSAAEANDGLITLNDMLDNWSTESLTMYGSDSQPFTLVPNQFDYEIGPGGDFDTARPVRITGAYTTVQGEDFPIGLMGMDEYNRIPLKTQTQQIVERLVYINSNPFGTIKVWPVPTDAVPIILDADYILTSIPTLATVIAQPPGFALCMRYTLALLLAPDYGIEPNPAVIEIAKSSKANVKRANRTKQIAQFDLSLAAPGPEIWQTGSP